LFAALDPGLRRAFEQRCRWRDVALDQTIIDRDEDGNDVFFLVAGRARIVIYSETGREVSFDELEPGACVGELAAIDGAPRSARRASAALTETGRRQHRSSPTARTAPFNNDWVKNEANKKPMPAATAGSVPSRAERLACSGSIFAVTCNKKEPPASRKKRSMAQKGTARVKMTAKDRRKP
jgi:hypothetical protein